MGCSKLEEYARVVLEWEPWNATGSEVSYFLDGRRLGRGDAGFDRFLNQVSLLEPGTEVIVRYAFFLSTGGQDFGEDFPFATQQGELEQLVETQGLRLSYEADAVALKDH